ncbi:hypothetical protein MCP1_600011 [Candidatus Terasakiella magnetica]|nr:hypothetical protein MCP1_600011 [Candidatus Terasakiella magnetica]
MLRSCLHLSPILLVAWHRDGTSVQRQTVWCLAILRTDRCHFLLLLAIFQEVVRALGPAVEGQIWLVAVAY